MNGGFCMQYKTLILNSKDVSSLLGMDATIEAVASAYKSFNAGNAVMPPITSIDLPEHNGEMDFKAGYSREENVISMKIASGYWDNPQNYGLSSCVALICLFDARNGVPLCVMDGSLITGVRTGAAGAVAARALARKNSEVVAVIGAGGQARMQVLALSRIFPLKQVRVWCRGDGSEYCRRMGEELPGVEFLAFETAQDAVCGADIVVTTTPSREALVMDEWIQPGMHITAVGSDSPGKQELDPAIFRRASKIVNDSITECVRRGDTQHPIALGYIRSEDIHAEIGEILLGRKPGRESDDEITIYDTTGLSVLDIHTAAMVYHAAVEQGLGTYIDIL